MKKRVVLFTMLMMLSMTLVSCSPFIIVDHILENDTIEEPDDDKDNEGDDDDKKEVGDKPDGSKVTGEVVEPEELTLESWIESEDGKKYEKGLNLFMDEKYLSMSIGAEGNTLIYYVKVGVGNVYVTKEVIETSEDWPGITDEYQTTVDEDVAKLRESYGLEIDNVRYVYVKFDGTELYSRDYDV